MSSQCNDLISELVAANKYNEVKEIGELMMKKNINMNRSNIKKVLHIAKLHKDMKFSGMFASYTAQYELQTVDSVQQTRVSDLLHTHQIDAAIALMNELHDENMLLSSQLYSLILKALVDRNRPLDAYALWTHMNTHKGRNSE